MLWSLIAPSTSVMLTLGGVWFGELCRRETFVLGVFLILLESVKPASDCDLDVRKEGDFRVGDRRVSSCDLLLSTISPSCNTTESSMS